jgi:hypothetical protein
MILLDIQRIIFPIIIILSGFYLILLLCKSIFHLFFPKKPKIHSSKNRVITITPAPELINKVVEAKVEEKEKKEKKEKKEEKVVIVSVSKPKKKKQKTEKSKRSSRKTRSRRN